MNIIDIINEIAENYKIVGQDKDLYILDDKESANE